MLLLQKNSIVNVLSFLVVIASLSACSTDNAANVNTTFITAEKIERLIPNTDILDLRDVQWIIITPNNIQQILTGQQENVVLFALTREGFENLTLNMNDIMSLVRQQRVIIQTYKES